MTTTTIDEVVEEQKKEDARGSAKASQKAPTILRPVSQRHILQILDRTEPAGLEDPQEKIPAIPDVKKAVADYNSIDYQIIAMNLWKSKAREFF